MNRIPYKNVSIFYGILFVLFSGCGTVRVQSQQQKTGGSESTQQVHVDQLVKSTTSWDGLLLPSYPAGQPEITILRIVIPAGVSLDMHQHPVINAGLLVKGTLTVETESGQTLHLNPGESIVEVANTWHYGKNESAELAEIIVFYAGAEGVPLTVHQSSKE